MCAAFLLSIRYRGLLQQRSYEATRLQTINVLRTHWASLRSAIQKLYIVFLTRKWKASPSWYLTIIYVSSWKILWYLKIDSKLIKWRNKTTLCQLKTSNKKKNIKKRIMYKICSRILLYLLIIFWVNKYITNHAKTWSLVYIGKWY